MQLDRDAITDTLSGPPFPRPAATGTMGKKLGAVPTDNLALSVNQQTVWANPKVVTDPAGYAAKLAPVLGMDKKVLTDRLADRSHAFVYLARKVDDATADAVKKLDLEGVDFVPESKRFYPAGTLAAPLLGGVGIDNDGLGGLEVQYDKTLAGKPGGKAGKPARTVPARTGLALYDLGKDPGEKTNLAEEHPEVVERLKKLADRARKDLGDSATKTKGAGVRAPGRI